MKYGKVLNFEGIVETLPFGIIYLESDRILYLNTSGEQILGVSREKIYNTSFYSLPFSSNVIQNYKKIIDSGKTARIYEESFVNYFGNNFILNFYFVPVPSKKLQYIVVMEDCSFLKEVEKKSVEYTNIERLSILFASMAHEIKNPLGVIKGTVQLIEKDKTNFDKEAFDIVISEINRIEKIIQELLDYSSPKKINVEFVNIHEILDKAILNLSSQIRDKKISIIKEYDTTLPDFLADQESLYRAFFNVIKNAVEACYSNGKVVITTKINMDLRYRIANRDVNYLIVEITDNGEGMSEEDLKKIFTPFFSKKRGGTGLGMVYVQKVVLDHNGFIKINSTPSSGTKVSIYLPMKVVI